VTDTVQPTYGSTANTVCQGNDARLHTQNTDTGTNQSNFQIGSGGPKLNNGGASLLRIRSATDQADVVLDTRAIRFQIQGATYYHTIQPTSAPGSNIVFDLPATGTALLGDNSTIDGGVF
jgi:hypothetical protein